jgi:TrmH family RNA methyltransferase
MNYISSMQNTHIKKLRKLHTSSSFRAKTHQTVLDGTHVCESYLKSGGEFRQLFVARSMQSHPEISFVLASVDLQTTELFEVPDSLLASISAVEEGGWIIGVVDIPTPHEVRRGQSALLLEDIQDPGNVGTLLRTAAAAGITQVFTSSGTAGAWSPKVIRAGMGAHFVLDIHENVGLSEIVQTLAVPVYATSLTAKKSLYESDLSGPVAWVFGNEGAGVSGEIMALCGENTVVIPQSPKVESLNVAAAAAVCLFEHVRQQKAHR